MTDPYERWAKETSRAWLERVVSNAVGKRCDGTWRGLGPSSNFVEGTNPLELVNEIVDIVYNLWFGENDCAPKK